MPNTSDEDRCRPEWINKHNTYTRNLHLTSTWTYYYKYICTKLLVYDVFECTCKLDELRTRRNDIISVHFRCGVWFVYVGVVGAVWRKTSNELRHDIRRNTVIFNRSKLLFRVCRGRGMCWMVRGSRRGGSDYTLTFRRNGIWFPLCTWY